MVADIATTASVVPARGLLGQVATTEVERRGVDREGIEAPFPQRVTVAPDDTADPA